MRILNVKNVSQQIQKISYRLPASKVFSMGYPVPLKLSPGMSYPIRVRPATTRWFQCPLSGQCGAGYRGPSVVTALILLSPVATGSSVYSAKH